MITFKSRGAALAFTGVIFISTLLLDESFKASWKAAGWLPAGFSANLGKLFSNWNYFTFTISVFLKNNKIKESKIDIFYHSYFSLKLHNKTEATKNKKSSKF